MGTICRIALPGTMGGLKGYLGARYRQRYNAASTSGMVLELDRRDYCKHLLLTDVISKISKFMLNLSKMVIKALIVMLSVVLKPM
jgi:hypothetical protein